MLSFSVFANFKGQICPAVVTMAARNITFISDLDNMRDDYTLKVCIIRLWRSFSESDPTVVKSIEMILMDEMGTKIRASVYRKDFQRFDSKLKEDDAIYIRSPTIAPNKYTFKISDVTSKLNLHGQTTVHECLGFQSKTKYEFCFVSFETIISATTTSNISIDVIGEVVSLGKLDSRDVSKSKHRLTLQIRNLEGLQVNVILFADFAYQVISYLEAHKQVGRVVIILQFARLNVYNGIPSVNNYFDHTRMFINADLPEIVAFTDSLVGLRGIQNPSSSLTFDSSQSYNEYEDFLNNHKVKNVVDLLEPQEVGKFIIVGTIYGIRQDIDWYYDACSNCGKKVDRRDVFSGPDSGDASVVVECSTDKCKKKEISSAPRYKIPIRVQDDSGTITLTLFDRDAYRLVKQRASELIEKIKQAGDNPRMYPYDLKCLVHKKMAFKIDVNRFNVSNNYNRFGILGYTLDSNVINALEKKLSVEAGNSGNPDDTEIASHEASHETKSLKDAISQTGDNLTPSMPDKSEATSPFKFNSPPNVKKRNVGDTIDVDEYDNVNSSTKVPRLNSKVDGNTETFKGVVNRNKNVCTSMSNGKMSKQPMLQTPSYLNFRTPLSNISNVMDISNNSFQAPLPNIGMDSNDKINGVVRRNKNITSSESTANMSKQSILQNPPSHLNVRTPLSNISNVELAELKNAPPSYEILFKSGDSKSKHFMKNIRSYNSMFSFTSMGGKIDSSINRGNAPYIFRLSGQNYHSIGSLLPNQGFKPKFSQLYIYDTDNEIANRRTCLGGENQRSTSNSSVLDDDIIQDLKLMLDSNNVLVQSYRMVRDCFNENPCADIKLRIIGRRDQDGRTYNLPSASEVAALIVGDIGDSIDNRDIVVQTSSELTYHIEVLHLQATASGPTVQ
ncbi:unnamed protein product [Lactuca virosa]|uniref:Replication factor A C-terminal domain-containing protein n=1 Tax=Lactuca virosa TaxID=75947 RepID=A0AAU9M0L1_9ASTR|nr:unnamed protein product [Lactuca virosa]